MEGNEERWGIREEGCGGGELEGYGAGEMLECKTERDGEDGESWTGEIDEEGGRDGEMDMV